MSNALKVTKRIWVLSVLGSMAIGLQAQVVVNTALTPSQLIQDVLLGAGITVSNVTFNGIADPATPQEGTGSFTATGSNLNIPAGIILSSGLAGSIPDVASGFQSDILDGDFFDADLETIADETINDAAVLEFDFVPNGDSVKFRYVFGSEEYPEFVCSYNDAFGFFLSGPGISGPYALGAVNIALVPGTTTPVTIDNVNNGYNNNGDPNDPTCPPVNPDFFINNETGTTVVYDGFTVVLEAKYFVQCGQTYHIKLAIGDAIDQAYDSGVFLEAGSFSSSPFVPSLTPGPGIVGDNIYESCFDMSLNYLRIGSALEADTFQVTYTGTFTNGEDIVPPLPVEVIFPAGVSSIPFLFNAPIDTDGLETITITVVSISECTGDTIENVFNFFIDAPPPLLAVADPFSVDCGGQVEIGAVVTGGYGVYTYDWGNGNTDTTLVVAPLSDTTYPLTVTDVCGLTTTVDVPVIVVPSPNPFAVTFAPALTVQGNSVQESCYEVQLNFSRTGGTAFADTAYVSLSGTSTSGVDYTDIPVQVIFAAGLNTVSIPVTFPQDPDGQETLIITLGDVSICNGGFSELSFTFSITQTPELVVFGGDQFIPCGGSALLQPTTTGGFQPYTYLWENQSTFPNQTVTTNEATIFTVIITDDCGNTAEGAFNVDLLPAPPIQINVVGSDEVIEACESATIVISRPASNTQGDLFVELSYGGMAVEGTDFDGQTSQVITDGSFSSQFVFQPFEDGVPDSGETVVIYASYTDACGRTVSDSVIVTINDAPPIILTTSDITVECGPDSLAITVLAQGGYPGGLDLSWNTGDEGSVTYVQTQTPGVYVVTATDACGRSASATANVFVLCDIVVPNVFSPNGDGQNDRFDIDGILSTTNTVRVFNRWGQIVFEAENYRNNWSASGVPDGTYFYEVIVPREPAPLTGSLTILR